MDAKATTRKLTSTLLIMMIALWAEAGLALVQGDQVMQCSMSMHQMQAMGEMSCCPIDEAQSPAMSAERPPCCSVSSQPERPLGFVVSAKRVEAASLELVAVVPQMVAAPANRSTGVEPGSKSLPFIKPVLELKTDLRI